MRPQHRSAIQWLIPEKLPEVLRTVHSFDPCIACAIHTLDVEGKGNCAREGAVVRGTDSARRESEGTLLLTRRVPGLGHNTTSNQLRGSPCRGCMCSVSETC